MTSEIEELLAEYQKLIGSLPEIQGVSRKVQIYDRYLSEGGEEKDSRDYFEILRIVEGGNPSETSLPPKIPMRSDYELMSEAICYYLKSKDQTKISTSDLKGFLVPENTSQGEFNSIKNVANKDGSTQIHVYRSSIEENIINVEVLAEKLKSLMGHDHIAKIGQWLEKENPDTTSHIESIAAVEHLTVQERIIAEVQANMDNTVSSIDSQIDDIQQLKKFVISQLNEEGKYSTTSDEADEVIRAIAEM